MTNNASSNAYKLKPLPVPALDATLDNLRTMVSAVATSEQQEATDQAIEDFRTGAGPALQAELEKYSAAQDAEHTSWLADRWLADYLAVRTPLPSTTNMTFQIDLEVEGHGFDRAATAIRRITEIHLLQARGQMPEERDINGEPLSARQWIALNGGMRHPLPGRDEFRRSTKRGANRTIGVLLQGRMWDVHISDASGHALSTTTIRAALDTIATAGRRAVDQGFADMTYLGSEKLAEPFAKLIDNPYNADTYRRMIDQLFIVSLDTELRSPAEHQRRATFEAGVAWAYKPITYVINLEDDYAAMHVEHSTIDAPTLATAVKRMQDVVVPHRAAGSAAAAQIEEITWRDVPEEIAGPLEQPRLPELKIVSVPAALENKNAAAQLILQIAQQLTFGEIRSVSEAVDMRGFKAGRTESLHAVTPESVGFVAGLVADEPVEKIRALLHEAVAAYEERLAACRSGQGVERHLWALNFLSDQPLELLTDPGVKAARAGFLSTASLGSDQQIVRPSFLGVGYTPKPGAIEYCVSYRKEQGEFVANLQKAGELLNDAL